MIKIDHSALADAIDAMRKYEETLTAKFMNAPVSDFTIIDERSKVMRARLHISFAIGQIAPVEVEVVS
ncbi:hypothetical protein UFOVP83_48 [uncultured Caudovirales phage]|uniref:Uncharacterized protein n=1 Tax=uncultured Caudovirales phage TaxID=2100421 RepID=A0A6J5TB77_9CAUD|nr:hypothetical protein UFOVP83_48 [uncultured Caudovirales phage]